MGESDGYPRSGFWVANAGCHGDPVEVYEASYNHLKKLERVDGESLVLRRW
jgi:hypothetical protein